MVNTSFEFYRDNLPFGYPVIRKVTWTNASHTELDVAPESGNILFVHGISFLMSQDFAISAGDLTIGHSSATAPNDVITITDEKEFLALCDSSILAAFPSGTNQLNGSWCFKPPVRCRNSDAESFEIKEGNSITISAGTLIMVVHGWQMAESEYNEVT